MKWISRTVEDLLSTAVSPWQQPNTVRIEGILLLLTSLDPISTARARHNSSTFNGRSECEIHISAAIPILDLSPPCAFIRPMVVSYASPMPRPFVIVASFSRLRWRVVSRRIASMLRDTSRNLDTGLLVDSFGYFFGILASNLQF